ncbi:transporter substrate-binding domain-containing protein [Nitratireductor sp. XY-223]|uniref:transporter substrate-binding domain-containing protein n=1 Tax=Nitratireductor sp. XY-223 TaxID=2561926 RepID=UPI0010A9EB88|nr:transporter substrate-binding domain-containing protein [Nitratireductor sp. XY-223]
MRKLLAALGLVLLTAAAAFGDEVSRETLHVGVDPGYPPFSEIDDADRLIGFDIDIARELCVRMDVECAFVRQDWEGLIPALRAGRFDAIVSSMSITEKRRELVAFTERYYSSGVRFVARKGSGFDADDAAGRTVGAIRATVASDWLEDNRSRFAGIRLYDDQGALDRALIEGRVDAMFGDALGFWKWLGSPEGAGFAYAGEPYRLDEGIGIALRREDEALLRRLNDALGAILADGTYGTINARYFPFSIY